MYKRYVVFVSVYFYMLKNVCVIINQFEKQYFNFTAFSKSVKYNSIYIKNI